MRWLVVVAVVVGVIFSLVAGEDHTMNLAEASFGKLGADDSRANIGEVVSMGRDDDDGHATKWDIGGGE